VSLFPVAPGIMPEGDQCGWDIGRLRIRQRGPELVERHASTLACTRVYFGSVEAVFFRPFLWPPFFPECFLPLPAFP
jgi:hypothetical protein